MDRIACAFIARYELMLRARSEPALLRRPVAVADLAGPGRLGAVSPLAEALGVKSGQLAASARARCPELDVLAPDPERLAAAEEEILAALGRISPRLDSDRRGGFFLGLAGLERLSGGERALAVRVREELEALGLPATVAIADRPFTAWVAARRARPIRIVPAGGDAAVLAGIPLVDLPLGDPGHELLGLLGIADAAQVAALPPGELARRLGADGAALEKLLRGETPAACPREEMVPGEPERAELELDVPLDDLEALLFLGKSLVDRVMAALAGGAAGRRVLAELRIEVRLDDRSVVSHVLRPAEPAMEARPLVELYRLWLERRPFAAPVAALAMVATRVAKPTARQLSLLRQREEREAAALDAAIAKLEASFGAGCVVRPILVDTHRPESRVGWHPVTDPSTTKPTATATATATGTDHGHGHGHGPRPTNKRTDLVIRLRPPAELIWDTAANVIHWRGHPHHVATIDGPHRVCGEWWNGDRGGFDRSYYWVTTRNGARLWLFRDERDGHHYLHGVAD